jgi:hypothetical protein
VQGTTVRSAGREWLGVFGLTSNTGIANHGGSVSDKVALYAAINMFSGTSDGWAFNTVTQRNQGTGAVASYGYEVDCNNLDNSVGAYPNGSAAAWGVGVTGLGSNGSSAFWANSATTSANWTWGMYFQANGPSFSSACIHVDTSSCPVGLDMQNANFTAAAITLNYSGSTNGILWSNSGDAPAVELVTQSQNTSLVGAINFAIHTQLVSPTPDATVGCGNPSFRWQSIWSVTSTVSTSDSRIKNSIKKLQHHEWSALDLVNDLHPVSYKMNVGGHDWIKGTKKKTVHSSEMKEVSVQAHGVPHYDHEIRDGKAWQKAGSRKHKIYHYDEYQVLDEDGKPAFYTVKGVKHPAILQEPRMIEIDEPTDIPVARPGKRVHLGFLANEVRDAFDKHTGMDCAVHLKSRPEEDPNETEHIRETHMIPVLWRAVQELHAAVKAQAELVQAQADRIQQLEAR